MNFVYKIEGDTLLTRLASFHDGEEGWTEIEADSHEDIYVDAGMVKVKTQAEKDAELLADAKANALQKINAEYAAQMRALTGDATAEERETWTRQESAARSHVAATATAADTALLNAVKLDSETLDDIAAKIIGKAEYVQGLVGLAIGIKRTAEASVENAVSPDDVGAALAVATSDMDAAISALSQQ